MQKYLDGLKNRTIGDAPNIFNTDDAKLLSPDYNPTWKSPEEVLDARSKFNTMVHQTANAIAKKAFVKYLDEVVSKLPEEKQVVLVTSGGVAAGKGFALENDPNTKSLVGDVGAVWDAAGEQNATENPWILDECRKRNLKMIYAFVHGDPQDNWTNPKKGVVERANKKGRMVDARVYADSYAEGPRNFQKFWDEHRSDPDCLFYIFNNATGGLPKRVEAMPEGATDIDADRLYAQAVTALKQKGDQVKPAVLEGGTKGERIWKDQTNA